MLGDALRLSPLHDDRRRGGWSRQKPSPKSLLLCYINSWLINGRYTMGTLEVFIAVLGHLCLNFA